MGGAIIEVRSQNDWDAHVHRGAKPVVVDFTGELNSSQESYDLATLPYCQVEV